MTRRVFIVLLLGLLSACGFHLRGQADLPFKTFYLLAPDVNSPFVNELRRNLLINKVMQASSVDKADMVIQIVNELPDQQILTLGGGGRVSEFQLRFRVNLHAYDKNGRDWIAADEMTQIRNYSYDDTKILAKEAEATLLNQSMRSDMAQQIVRRLSHAKAQ